MVDYFRGSAQVFMRYRHLLNNLVMRDIKVKYRRSFLGILWSLLNPLLMMLVLNFVFQNMFDKMGIASNALPLVSATGAPPSFPVYLLSGQLIFSFFNEATSSAMDSVYANAGLIKKVYIPKYIFPLEKVMFSMVNTLFSMVALLLVILLTRSPLTPWALLFPVVILLLFAFNLGVGMILSALVVFFRDIKHLYSVFVLALTYLTPIFYSEGIFAPGSPMLIVIRLNPLYWFVSMFRYVVVFGLAPTITMWVMTFGWAAVMLLVGLVIFRKTQDNFILYI